MPVERIETQPDKIRSHRTLKIQKLPQLEISVTGTGSAIRPSERALISLTAASPHLESPAEASSIITETAHALRDIITPLCPQDEEIGRTSANAPIVHWSMSTMDTSEHSPRQARDKDGNYVNTTGPQFSARAAFIIKFQDFDALNTVATQFSAMHHVSIGKIDWKLTDATFEAIKGDARKDAGLDALQKAKDHAEVFAGVIGEEEWKERVKPVSVSEEKYYSRSTKPHLHVGKTQRMTSWHAGSEELHFEPEDVKVEVNVNAKFVVEL